VTASATLLAPVLVPEFMTFMRMVRNDSTNVEICSGDWRWIPPFWS
jgi:hypothetical protein